MGGDRVAVVNGVDHARAGTREVMLEPSVLAVPELTLDVPALLAFAYRGER